MGTAHEVALKRLAKLIELRDHIMPQWEKIRDQCLARTKFLLQRTHPHAWVQVAEVVTVEGLGTRLQFHRFCYCGRRQVLIQWWNQFKEPCYHE